MKKFLVVALAAIMVFTLAACGESSSTETTAEASKGTLIMGTNATFPPYESTDDQGNIIGIDPEIAQAICDKLGYTLEIKDMEFDSLLSAVQAGSVDMVLAGLTVTEERAQSVNFSDSYASGKQVIIVKEGSSIASVDDLANAAAIGVQAGTTGDLYCTDDFGEDHVKQYTNGPLAIQALLNGQVDCVVIDNNPAKEYVAANEGLTILETSYVEEDYAIAIAKDNTELQAEINQALAELKADGTIDTIVAKYINANN